MTRPLDEAMRGVCLLVLFGIGAGLRAQGAPEVSARAFVEMATDRSAYFIGQPIRVRIRFGIERDFLEKNVLQSFQGSIAVPAQLLVSWWGALPGVSIVPDPESRPDPEPAPNPTVGDRVTFVLNGRVAFAKRSQIERPTGVKITVLELQRTFVAERVGTLSLRAPELRFRYATKFREDFINGRVAEDSSDAVARAETIRVAIRPVPETGRPAAFTGGVGTFQIHAMVTPRRVTVGESLRLVLEIRGDGNLSTFGAPTLADLPEFHVRGTIDDKNRTERMITYDLMVVREVASMPRIAFAFFDPRGEGKFRTVYTESVPLVVAPLPAGKVLDLPGARVAPAIAGQNDIFGLKPGSTRTPSVGRSSTILLFALLVFPWLAAAGLRSWLRGRRTHKQPDRVRARGAAAVFRSRGADSCEGVADALAEYLAARLHVPTAAVIGDDLPARLEGAGVSSELATRSARVLHDLVAARYGGAAAADGAEAAAALVAALEREIQSPA